MAGVGEVFGDLALQAGRIDGRQERFQRLGQLARRGSQDLFPILVCLGARRVLVTQQQAEVIDVVLAHTGEPVEPCRAVGCQRCQRRGSHHQIGQQTEQASRQGPPPEMPHIASLPISSAAQIA